MLQQAEVGARLEKEGIVHHGINIAFENALHVVNAYDLTDGKVVTVYGQTEVTKDLFDARKQQNGQLLDQAENVMPHAVDTDRPYVTFSKAGENYKVECAFIAGCDGYHGVSRSIIPPDTITEYEMTYPFGWLGILSETPPVSSEVVYGYHDRGFALCSMRNPQLSRYYIQVPTGDVVENWSDEAFWTEFKRRLPKELVSKLVTGPSIEKSIAPLRSFVASDLRYGRLFLAGDAGHIVPPTGAKGLNLAVSDIYYLSNALIAFFNHDNEDKLNGYSALALDRIWKSVRFSMWATKLLHRWPENNAFENRIQLADLHYLVSSEAAMRSFAENYVGLPY